MYLYTDPILTAAKKYRCRCEGVYAMNGVINGLLVRLRYQQKGKRVHNKNIFLVSNTLSPFTIFNQKFVNNNQLRRSYFG